ncbi:PREDICTED: retinol dehydrogenase 13-like [Priapulus caudatus]|uniref:Retinol dehydrogenase 13-like n=1 Tax=Priapulus caudatus TaxID=37621 RepID=A0ABM1E698_PRICU|nr:PREDICTED: retinol dehydrogenase 13-like [Priapulus caudatus]
MSFYKPPAFYYPISMVLAFGGGSLLLRDLFIVGPPYKGDERLDGRTVVITGASSGIGKETARALAKRGGRIIMGCRNVEEGLKVREEIIKEARNPKVVVRKLDLASLKSIREFAEKIKEKEDRVDVLVNNAGVMRCPKQLTEDGFEMQLGVNHLGHFYLTNLLLDKIKSSTSKAHHSRIINVTCKGHMAGNINFDDLNGEKKYNPGQAYNQSKLAILLFSVGLRNRLRGTDVNVYTVNPGLTATNLSRHLGMHNFFLSRWMVVPLFKFFKKTPYQAVQTMQYATLSENIENKTGTYLCQCQVLEAVDQMYEKKTAERLWTVSEKWTRLPLADPLPPTAQETPTKKD